MNMASRAELLALMETSDRGPKVSIYMPTYHGAETRQDPIRFKNLLNTAQLQLAKLGVRNGDAQRLLAPAQQFLLQTPWRDMGGGMAAFLAEGFFRAYPLPGQTDEFVLIGDRWHLKPLIALMSDDERFYVLALSQDEVRLFQCTQRTIDELDLPRGVPTSLAEAMRFDVEQRQAQWHTQTAVQHVGATRPALFHGHGAGNDGATRKRKVDEFLQRLSRGVTEAIGESRAPLVLAGVEYLRSTFQDSTTYPHVLREGIGGSPEEPRMSPRDLHTQAWAIVEPHFRRAQDQGANDAKVALAHNRGSAELPNVVQAAAAGRVATLFVPSDRTQWGAFDRQSGQVEVHAQRRDGDEDLLDMAAIQTMLNDGQVFVVPRDQMPFGHTIVATYRY